jgi:hypothetical protein
VSRIILFGKLKQNLDLHFLAVLIQQYLQHMVTRVLCLLQCRQNRERRREKQIINGDPVEQSASTSKETNYSAKSKASSKSLLDDCMEGDSPDKKVEHNPC